MRHLRPLIAGSLAAPALAGYLASVHASEPPALRTTTAAAPAGAPRPAISCSSGASGASGGSGGLPGFGWPFGPSGFSGASGFSGSSGQSPQAPPPNLRHLASSVDADLVDVDTVLAYEGAEAAGTGIVLGSKGEVLTNNHVIREATSVEVTDLGDRRSYRADVVGYDLSADVAVLRLESASGLRTAPIGNSSKLSKGTGVMALGNACGVGGTPSAATGKVTALDQSISASDELLGDEQLSGMIETSADLQPGDSGGSLVDTGTGKVVGVDTAGAEGYSLSGGAAGFAIPIATATAIAAKIEHGHSSSTIHVGPTAFLGVAVESARYQAPDGIETTGVAVESVIGGGPAAHAGLTNGDVIVSLAGRIASSPAAMTDELLAERPGRSVPIRWMDSHGHLHTATVKLGSGPPQ